jgi:hypothetical protein
MANDATLQDVLYNTEIAWAEVATTFATALPLIEAVDLSGLAREMQPQPIVRSRPWQGVQHVLMPWEGKSIKLRFRMTGLGASAAGAAPASDLATFLGLIIGNVSNGLATGTTFTGAGTAAAPGTTVANGALAGALLRGGQIADGRVGGEFLAVSSHAANVLNLLMAAAAAPNNGDVLYASKMIYPSCLTPSSFETPTSFRLRILTSNGKYDLRGCFPLSPPRFAGVDIGGVPEFDLDVGVSAVVTNTDTFPSATVPQRHASSPVTNGTFQFQQVGTTTRATKAIRSISFDLGFTGEGIKGPGGLHEGQVYQTARRKPGMATLDFVVDNDGPNTMRALAIADPLSRTSWQALWSLNCADGRGFAIYWPNLRFCKVEPLQVNEGGYNRERVSMEAQLGPTLTSDLTASPWRIAMA